MCLLPAPLAHAEDPPPDLPVLAIEADPDGGCPAGTPPYDAWCIGIGGGLTQIDGTPLPANAIRLPVAGVLGRMVVSPDGAALGRIVNVLADGRGEVRAAVIDFGGFMGVGSRTIAVEWALLRLPPPGDEGDIVLDLDEAAITATPAYDGSDEAIVIAPSPPDALPSAASPPTAAPPPKHSLPPLFSRPPPMLPPLDDAGSTSKADDGS